LRLVKKTVNQNDLSAYDWRISRRQGAQHRMASKNALSRAPKAVSCNRLLDGTES
jgi:hypothetical protein